jgi:hypothetical protein
MPECKHEIELITCGICTPPPPPEPRTWRPDDGWGSWFTARHYSACYGCDRPIEPGDQIRSDGAGGWLCVTCGSVTAPGPHTIRLTGGLL